MPTGSTPSLKITYFNIRGRAETARLTMVVGKLPFEDERITNDQWGELRPNTPYLALPTLHINGVAMAQSNAITRYLGKLCGLYPSDPLAGLKVDETLDTLFDFAAEVWKYLGDDKEQLLKARESLVNESVPRYWGGLEKKLEAWDEGAPWAVGGEVSVADMGIFSMMTQFKCGVLDYVPVDLLDSYPRTLGIYDAVNDIPEVVEWYKKHPIEFFSQGQ